MNDCECRNWARDGEFQLLTRHHMNCKHFNPAKDAIDIITGLLIGIESWASDEDGIHPSVMKAYAEARIFVGFPPIPEDAIMDDSVTFKYVRSILKERGSK